MSNSEVWTEAKLIPMKEELLVRRLGQYRKWAIVPSNHAHILAAVFGQSRRDAMPTVDEDGRLLPGANPWTKR
eukprot:4859443-Heterocapsa_arctica.AAC.1